MAVDGAGDVGVDVECGRARGPVARALLAVDRAPREGGAAQPELLGPRTRQSRGCGAASAAPLPRAGDGCSRAPAARRTRCPRRRGRRSRARSGPWPGSRAPRPAPRPGGCGTARSAAPAGSRGRRRARRRRRPRRRPGTRAGLRASPSKPSATAFSRLRVDLVAQQLDRLLRGPVVGQELDQRAAACPARARAEMVTRPRSGSVWVSAVGFVDLEQVLHPGRHRQPAAPRLVARAPRAGRGRPRAGSPAAPSSALAAARVVAARPVALVGEQVRLDGDAQRLVDRLDLVGDRRDRARVEGHEPARRHLDRHARLRAPVQRARRACRRGSRAGARGGAGTRGGRPAARPRPAAG